MKGRTHLSGDKTNAEQPLPGVLNENNTTEARGVVAEKGLQQLLQRLVDRASQGNPAQGAFTELQQPATHDVSGHQADQKDAHQRHSETESQIDQILKPVSYTHLTLPTKA